MKKIILFSCVLLSSGLATATTVKNPQIRACRVAGGEYSVANSADDQLGLCRIGRSYVGAIDILNRDDQIEMPLSLHYYKKGITVCPTQNLTLLTNLDGEELSVCLYSDDSVIDIETLTDGSQNEKNGELNRLLGIKN